MNQFEVRRGLDYLGIATPQSQENWAEENIERGAKRQPEAVEFKVYDGTDSTAVGTACSRSPMPRHSRIRHRDLRRVGAARSSQRAPKLDTSSASPRLPGFPALPVRHRETGSGRSPCRL